MEKKDACGATDTVENQASGEMGGVDAWEVGVGKMTLEDFGRGI